MPGIPNISLPPYQAEGSEYGGVEETIAGGIQPKGVDALTNGELLRLGYLTGVEDNTDRLVNIDDRRQMMGLRPADGRRPWFLRNVSPVRDPRLDSEAEVQGWDED